MTGRMPVLLLALRVEDGDDNQSKDEYDLESADCHCHRRTQCEREGDRIA